MNQLFTFASVCFLLFVPCVNSDGLSVLPNPIVEESEEIAFQKLSDMEKNMQHGIESLIKQLMPMIVRGSASSDLSPQCMGSILKVINGLRDMKMWAFRMVDSFGLPIGGMFRGTAAAIGSYSQCIDIEIPRGYSKVKQNGKFCVVRFRSPLPPRPRRIQVYGDVFTRINATFKTEAINELKKSLSIFYDTPLKVGMCIPSTCSEDDLFNILHPMLSRIGQQLDVEFCIEKEPFSLETDQMIFIVMYLLLILVNIIATIWDEIPKKESDKKPHPVQKMIRAFSLRRNIVSLVSTKPAVNRSLDAMNGMRFISITWVLLGHSYFLFERNLVREMLVLYNYVGDISFQVVMNGFHSVETFILITSVLISYHLVRHVDSGKGFPVFGTIVLRMARFLPSLLLVISIVIVLPAFGSGPFFKEMMTDQANLCRQKWWHNALFFGNASFLAQMCLPHTWYLSAEFQCFILSMVYFALYFKNKKWGNAFLIFMLTSCILSTGIVTYALDLTPTLLARNIIDLRFSMYYAQVVYMMPYVHLGVYAVGLYLGTYLAKNPKVTISMNKTLIGWTVAFVSAIALVYATSPWNKGESYTTIEAVIYSALQRTAWGVCMAWVVFACYAEKGGVVNSFLSWPGWQPFVKLSYLVYLVHLPIYFYISSSKLGPVDPTHFSHIFSFFGVLVTSHILAFFIKITFDSPISNIMVVLYEVFYLRPPKKSAEPQENTKC